MNTSGGAPRGAAKRGKNIINWALNPMVFGRFRYERGLNRVSRAGSGSVDIDFFQLGDLRPPFFCPAAKDPKTTI